MLVKTSGVLQKAGAMAAGRSLVCAAAQAANDPDNGFETISVRPRFVWGKGDTVNLPEILEAVDGGTWRSFTPRFQTSTTHVRCLLATCVLPDRDTKPRHVAKLCSVLPLVGPHAPLSGILSIYKVLHL